jgi:hypothetical protein
MRLMQANTRIRSGQHLALASAYNIAEKLLVDRHPSKRRSFSLVVRLRGYLYFK